MHTRLKVKVRINRTKIRFDRLRLSTFRPEDPRWTRIAAEDVNPVDLKFAVSSAESTLNHHFESLPASHRLMEVGYSLNDLGVTFQQTGKFLKSKAFLERALQLVTESTDKQAEILGNRFLQNLVSTQMSLEAELSSMGKIQEAELEFHAAVQNVTKYSKGVVKSEILLRLSKLYARKSHLLKAKILGEEALSILSSQSENQIITAQASLHLGIVCHGLREYTEAIEYLAQSLQVREKILSQKITNGHLQDAVLSTDIINVAMVLGRLAAVYSDIGNLNLAIQFHEREIATLQSISSTDAANEPKIRQLNKRVEELKQHLQFQQSPNKSDL